MAEVAEESAKRSANAKSRLIDRAHLAKQTLGDPDFETEILILFAQVVRNYYNQLGTADPAYILHALKSAARGVGAHCVADMALSAEGEVIETGRLSAETVLDMGFVIEDTCTYIEGLVQAKA